MQMRPKLRCNTGAVHLPECDDCSALEARVGAVEEDVDILETKSTQAETSLSELQSDVTQNANNITTLTRTTSSLNTRVTALEQGGGGGVTHITENNRVLDMRASEIVNALGNSTVLLVRTTTEYGFTYTDYGLLTQTSTDGTGWEFVFFFATTGTESYVAQTINDYPEIPK